MRLPAAIAVALGPAALAACAPVSVERAEAMCLDSARLAAAPRGEIAAGIGTGGPVSRVKIEIGSDYIQGRDPAAVFDTCVMQKSGQLPTRPLYDRPDWKG